MKVRDGFVSNSSSSSFIIAYKGDRKQLKTKLEEVFGNFPKNYPIQIDGKSLAKTTWDAIDESFKNLDEYKESYYFEDNSDDENEVFEYFDRGFQVYFGSFNDQDDPEDYFLCNSDIEYEDEDLIMKQEAGY